MLETRDKKSILHCNTEGVPMSQSLIRLPEASSVVSEQVSSVLGAVSAILSAGIFYVAFAIAL